MGETKGVYLDNKYKECKEQKIYHNKDITKESANAYYNNKSLWLFCTYDVIDKVRDCKDHNNLIYMCHVYLI